MSADRGPQTALASAKVRLGGVVIAKGQSNPHAKSQSKSNGRPLARPPFELPPNLGRTEQALLSKGVQESGLKRLMQLGQRDRLDVIAEGLPLLVENVATLSGDLQSLRSAGRKRGLWMLAGQADEEAAKVLILLDLLRMDQQDRPRMTRQIGRFNSHLARCIYAEMAQMNPADFAEVRGIVESMRPSHYLDGPNDVDWIFRNRLLANREERLYVDYIHEDEGNRWITPATNDDVLFGGPSPAVRDLVAAMQRLGCLDRRGLSIVVQAWDGQMIQDRTHWQGIVAINRSIVEALLENGLSSDDATDDDARRVIDRWTFPLGGLDISEVKVSRAALQVEQERWAASE